MHKSLGVNTSAQGEETPAEIAALGVSWVRTVALWRNETTGQIVNINRWIKDLKTFGIDVLLVIGSESVTDDETMWADRLKHFAALYGGKVLWQVGNESDARWEPGHTTDWRLDQRRALAPASWIMSADKLGRLIDAADFWLPSTDVIVGAGLCSGHAEWWSLVPIASRARLDGIGIHPYAKEPGSPELDTMIDAYGAYEQALWASEFASTTKGMAAYLGSDPRIAAAAVFALQGFDDLGLKQHPEAMADFLLATGGRGEVPVAMPPTIPPVPPDLPGGPGEVAMPVVPSTPQVPPDLPDAVIPEVPSMPETIYVGHGVSVALAQRGWTAVAGEFYTQGGEYSMTLTETPEGRRWVHWSQTAGEAYAGPVLEPLVVVP